LGVKVPLAALLAVLVSPVTPSGSSVTVHGIGSSNARELRIYNQ
jgi:hypothetical protein